MDGDEQIRAAALQAAAVLYGNLQAGRLEGGVTRNANAAETTVYLAQQFETYIRTGESSSR